MDKNKVTQEKAYQELKERVKADFPYTMSSAKIRAEVRKEFETVEEKKAKKTKKTQEKAQESTPGTTPGTTPDSNVITYEDLMNSAKTAKVRCERILETMFNESGEYIGDEITQHFKATCEFIVGLFTIDKTEAPDQDAQDAEFTEIQDA
jgi:hypothetical protein